MRACLLVTVLTLTACIGDPPPGGGLEAGGSSGSSGQGGATGGAGGSGGQAGQAGGGAGGKAGAATGGAGQAGAGGQAGGAGVAGEGGAGAGGSPAGGQAGAGEAGAGQGGAGAGGAGMGGGGAGGATMCGAGLELCGGVCAELSRDEANCGMCGKACAQGEVCVQGGCDQITDLQTGSLHACARFASGVVRCWGRGSDGQLGLGSSASVGDVARPTAVVTLGVKIAQVTTGQDSTCAVSENGELYCWGGNAYSQLGLGTTKGTIGDSAPLGPANLVMLGAVATQAAMSWRNACALLMGGDVRCWGDAATGRLGNPAIQDVSGYLGDEETPSSSSMNAVLGGPVKQLSLGFEHACAVMVTGKIRCWGNNYTGQLGLGHTDRIGDDETPASVPELDLGALAVQVEAFGGSTCALLAGGKVKCWGDNGSGQLGYGNTKTLGDDPDEVGPSLAEVLVSVDATDQVLSLSGSYDHICALLTGGRVRCWGQHGSGKLGYGNVDDVGDFQKPASAGDVDLGGEKVLQVSAGDQFTCARLASGNVRCWGDSIGGKLGYPTKNNIGDDEKPLDGQDVF